MKKAIVLAGDYAYIRQIETTIKSLSCYHREMKIYLFNQDIPQEWFFQTRKQLGGLSCQLIDVKLFDEKFDIHWTSSYYHISPIAYARYFIPQFVEEDRVLYLDSDLVVTGDLSDLFELDLGDCLLAASRFAFGTGDGFNSGVMLINNKRWKESHLSEQLIETTAREHANLKEGDQEVLNKVVGDDYILLDDTYNFQIGFDYGAHVYGHEFVFEYPLDPLPKILHYISLDKPWNTLSSGRLREVWWYYHGLEWSDILSSQGKAAPLSLDGLNGKARKWRLFTLTNTCDLPHIETLIQSLPDCQFHIAAFTDMAPSLKQLTQFDNVTLYERAIMYKIRDNIDKCDAILNLNRDTVFEQYLADNLAKDKPIFSFETTSNLADPREKRFAEEDVKGMIAAIRAGYEN